jgi:hypothetical protein
VYQRIKTKLDAYCFHKNSRVDKHEYGTWSQTIESNSSIRTAISTIHRLHKATMTIVLSVPYDPFGARVVKGEEVDCRASKNTCSWKNGLWIVS